MGLEQVRDAIRRSDMDALRELLRRPEVIRRLNDPEASLLHTATVGWNPEVIRLLLDAGASPNVKNSLTGTPPLLRAVLNGNYANVKLLIRAGVDVNAANSYWITPLYAAQTPEIVATLLAAGADPRLPGAQPCLIGPAVRGDAGITRQLIAAGADPSAASPRSGWTPLHAAAQNCRAEVVEVLLAAGADALGADEKGKTPLRYVHSGTPRRRHAIIAALVAAGDRNWAHVPAPCAGLQRALTPTWMEAPAELPELFKRLTPAVQARARAALMVLHPHNVPVELRMALQSAALDVPS